jgi:hypothetical protein
LAIILKKRVVVGGLRVGEGRQWRQRHLEVAEEDALEDA